MHTSGLGFVPLPSIESVLRTMTPQEQKNVVDSGMVSAVKMKAITGTDVTVAAAQTQAAGQGVDVVTGAAAATSGRWSGLLLVAVLAWVFLRKK